MQSENILFEANIFGFVKALQLTTMPLSYRQMRRTAIN